MALGRQRLHRALRFFAGAGKLFFMNQGFIYLASASPRRRELLDQLGVKYRVMPADLPEVREPGETVESFVRRMALAKACAVAGRTRQEPAAVLGADTVVVADKQMLGKPSNREEGLAMLALLSGRKHEVFSGVALVAGEKSKAVVDVTQVWFRATDEQERAAYWATGEPADKAGAYAVQGLGAVFIERIEGSFSGVMGLPLFLTAALLQESGYALPGMAKDGQHE